MIKKTLNFIYNRWLFTIIFVISIVSLLFFLGPNNRASNPIGVISADSARLLLENSKPGEYEKFVTDFCYSRFLKKDSSEDYKRIVEKYKNRIGRENTDYGKAYYSIFEINIGAKNLPESEANKLYLENMEVGKRYSDTNLTLYALSFYSVNIIKHGNFDSSRNLCKYGYDMAVKSKNQRFIYFFAINLGYLMNGAELYGAAQMYFEQALKSADAIHLDKSVLLNNMLSIMVTEKNEKQAEALWKKYFEPFKIDTYSYVGQLLVMNRCFLYQNHNKYDLAAKWIPFILDSLDNIDLKYASFQIKARQNLMVNGSNGDIMVKNKQLLFDAFPSSFEDFQKNIYAELESNPKYLTVEEIEKLENSIPIEEQGNYSYKHYKPFILEVKAKIFAVNKKVNEAYKLCEQSQNLRQEVDSYRDTLRRSDLAEKLKLNDLENQIQDSTRELVQRKYESNLYQWFSILLGAICFLVVYLILKERSINKYKEKLYLQEIASAEIQSENLSRENEMNNRIITLSKLIISKVDVVNKMLSNITQDNFQTAIKGIRGEFLNIQNAVSDAQPQLADKLLEDYSSIQNDFPNVVNLSITEKRIFVLSINGYNTKEIAGLLGLTSQYVNNARSSIRKKLEIHVNWKEVLVNLKNPNLQGNNG